MHSSYSGVDVFAPERAVLIYASMARKGDSSETRTGDTVICNSLTAINS